MEQGKLLAIATRDKPRAPMMVVDSAEVTLDAGVNEDSRGKSKRRQVTILSLEDWTAACAELGVGLPWTTRRANLLVQGLRLAHSKHALVQMGDVQLKVIGETEPCHRMDEQASGLRAALEPSWRGGVCCQVVAGGSIAVGDVVTLIHRY